MRDRSILRYDRYRRTSAEFDESSQFGELRRRKSLIPVRLKFACEGIAACRHIVHLVKLVPLVQLCKCGDVITNLSSLRLVTSHLVLLEQTKLVANKYAHRSRHRHECVQIACVEESAEHRLKHR